MARVQPARTFSTTRVEAFTDGVFAIAATLLVLDLTTNAFGRIGSDAEMWEALADMRDSFLAFVISFGLLSMMWVIHLQQWREIARVDGGLLWLNNVRLLFIVLIPFTTSLVAEYSEFYAGRMLLPINFFFAALLGFLSFLWASARDGHLLRDEAKDDAHAEGLAGLSAVICAAVAVVLAPWVGSWGFLAFVFNEPLTRVLQRRSRTRVTPGD
ncbi:TMEM175 family protein [Microbacterium sp. BK668]|uniref:TMEM175 family protein n=1 Tax=Microbacterium sp. BK668 TaxID=2512118 RepID=UPI00105DEA1C|nr:TMEM175 family protein [Microbacterium sp. BK668]TDN87483.1 putative membrane protein [Microbacterium sp. BK668]